MSIEPLTPEDERKIRDGAAHLDRYPTFGMSASVNMLRLFATLDLARTVLDLRAGELADALEEGDRFAEECVAWRLWDDYCNDDDPGMARSYLKDARRLRKANEART